MYKMTFIFVSKIRRFVVTKQSDEFIISSCCLCTEYWIKLHVDLFKTSFEPPAFAKCMKNQK